MRISFESRGWKKNQEELPAIVARLLNEAGITLSHPQVSALASLASANGDCGSSINVMFALKAFLEELTESGIVGTT